MQTIHGVALGPGDPELLTLKGLRLLKEADVIFYPGSLHQGKKKSFVYPLLAYHNLENKELVGFYLEMSDNRTSAKEVYSNTVKQIEKVYAQGKKVCVVCEGDISLYASFSYILNELQTLNLPVNLIPGINSFTLGAAKHQVPLSLLNDKIAIIPRVNTMEEINTYFKNFDTLVLMKIRSGWQHFEKALIQQNLTCYYCERLGTDQEFITTDLQEVSKREIPYFSLLIIKKNRKDD
ncbi:precorrin-2 C(20)-methyltransferase [Flavivirga aquatica]|uniref:precorrin-2 C(20)-methyltransferase n=1 Tax=Flavivirga aquatica TaxID=1849968 RepID=UPI000A9876CA|nr:precorrin-2 C(20)-methyltransferase [Flavivirga aquatica]